MSARFALPRKSVNSRGGAAGMASVVMDVPLFTALQRLWYLASMGILKQVPMYSVCPSPHLSVAINILPPQVTSDHSGHIFHI